MASSRALISMADIGLRLEVLLCMEMDMRFEMEVLVEWLVKRPVVMEEGEIDRGVEISEEELDEL